MTCRMKTDSALSVSISKFCALKSDATENLKFAALLAQKSLLMKTCFCILRGAGFCGSGPGPQRNRIRSCKFILPARNRFPPTPMPPRSRMYFAPPRRGRWRRRRSTSCRACRSTWFRSKLAAGAGDGAAHAAAAGRFAASEWFLEIRDGNGPPEYALAIHLTGGTALEQKSGGVLQAWTRTGIAATSPGIGNSKSTPRRICSAGQAGGWVVHRPGQDELPLREKCCIISRNCRSQKAWIWLSVRCGLAAAGANFPRARDV